MLAKARTRVPEATNASTQQGRRPHADRLAARRLARRRHGRRSDLVLLEGQVAPASRRRGARPRRPPLIAEASWPHRCAASSGRACNGPISARRPCGSGSCSGPLSFACALVAPHIGLFQRLELTTEDMRLRLRGQRPVHPGDRDDRDRKRDARHATRTQVAVPARPVRACSSTGCAARARAPSASTCCSSGPTSTRPVEGTPITNDQLLAAVIDRDPAHHQRLLLPARRRPTARPRPAGTLTVEPGQEAWAALHDAAARRA